LVVPTSRSTHQFPSGDQDFASSGEGGQHQQRRRGVIVHHDGRLGAGQCRQEPLGVHAARSAAAADQVVFQIAVTGGHLGHALDGAGRERRAAQVGVDDHTGGIDHGSQRSPELCGQHRRCTFGNRIGRRRSGVRQRRGLAEMPPHLVCGSPQRRDGGLVAAPGRQRAHVIALTKGIEGRNVANADHRVRW
jgi:hypothetical protein